jgi:cytochrome c553
MPRRGSEACFTRRSRARVLSLSMAAALTLLAGCRQDMQDQPKFVPQRGTTFFSDGRSVRPQVDHTVARGQLDDSSFFATGILNGKEADLMPFPVTMQVLERGQERFNIYCSPCHSRVGNGAGMIVERGYKPAANFHDEHRLAESLGHYFAVMTHGFGAMPDYSAQLTPADRWAVAAYIRALQLSQNARQTNVPAGTQIQNLKDIAQQSGYPESFAEPWAMPTDTSVWAEPSQGTPGMAPAGDLPPEVLNSLPSAPQASGKAATPNGAK